MAKSRTTFHRDFPVEHSYDGLRKALADEGEGRGRHEVSLSDYFTTDNTTFRLHLRAGTLESLTPPVAEGWSIDPRQAKVKARIISIDYDRDRIYARFTRPQKNAPFASTINLIEPDFLGKFRDWLEANQGRMLPEIWQKLSAINQQPLGEAELGLTGDRLINLRQAQQRALKTTLPNITYLWGPPGTGKTFTLAYIAQSLLNRGYKVLLLAPTNVAVDTALLATFKAFNLAPPGGYLLRAGFPERKELYQHPVLLAWQETLKAQQSQIAALDKKLRSIEIELIIASEEQKDKLKELQAQLKSEKLSAKNEQKETLWKLASNARLLATTVYSALHVKEVLAFMSTSKLALLVDEAAMVPRYSLLPLLEILAGSEGIQSGSLVQVPEEIVVCLAGDPLQLSPIFRLGDVRNVNLRHWLGESLMEGLLKDKQGVLADNITLLNEQSRMDPSICKRISATYYSNKLTTLADPEREIPPLVSSWPEDGIALLDPEKMDLAPEAPEGSRLAKSDKTDQKNLWVAMQLIKDALSVNENRSVLWLTPFRKQALAALKICDTYFSDAKVRAGTIHSSQGSEADLIIFDPVNVKHKWLKGGMGDELDIKRLLNVAVSRGRTQVLVLCSANKARANSIFWALLHDVSRVP